MDKLPSGVALAYSAIPEIAHLDEPLRTQVRAAFGDGFAVIWKAMAAISGVGLVASLFMKAMRLHTQVDERWGLKEGLSQVGVGEAGSEQHASVTTDGDPVPDDGDEALNTPI